MTKTNNIVCIGEAMVELSLSGESSVALGFAGDTLNTAIYLNRLTGHEVEVAYCTTLGCDPLSGRLKNYIESESISTQAVSYSNDKSVGLYAISTDSQGERTFSYWRSDSAARTLFNQGAINFDCLHGYNVVYLSAITLAILPAAVRTALLEYLDQQRQMHNTTVVFDSNYREALWESQSVARETVAAAWSVTDIALPSVDDEMDLFGDATEAAVIERLQSYGVTNGALKRGEAGPLSLNPEDRDQHLTFSPATTAVDTTAAGDSFNGGYLSAKLRGGTSEESLRLGHECAKTVVGFRGAIVPKPEWDQTSVAQNQREQG